MTDDVRTIEGSRTFPIEAAWRLVVPEGEAPAGGWPCVVALHGWGMNAASFSRICRPLIFGGAAFLFPQGPWSFEIRKEGRIKIGHAWYVYDATDEPFRTTLGMAERHLLEMIDDLSVRDRGNDRIDPDRVALFGFSQGAYTSYFIALRNTRRFRGMAGLGGGRLKPEFYAAALPVATRIPFRLFHGADDVSVPVERTEMMKSELSTAGFPVSLSILPGSHEITAEMLAPVSAALREMIGIKSSP